MEVIKMKRPPRVATIRCKFCDLDYALAKDWKRHVNLIHGKGAFACIVCPEVFYEEEDLVSHVQSAHGGRTRHYCKLCSNSYKQVKALTMHVALMHKIEASTFCAICDEEFHNTFAHKKHLQVHHGPQYVYYKCRRCVRSFRNKAHVGMHNEFDHSKDGKKNLLEYLKKRKINYKILSDGCKKCSVCNITFKYGIDVIKHVKLYHKKTDKFSCCQCDAVYSTRSSLAIHQRHDHGLLNHSCSICPPARKPSMAAPLNTVKTPLQDKKLPIDNRLKNMTSEMDGKENHNLPSDKIFVSRAPWVHKIIRQNVPSNLDLKEANEKEVHNLRHNIKAAFKILSTVPPSRLKASVLPLQNIIKPCILGRRVKALSLMYPTAHPFSNLPTYSLQRRNVSSKVELSNLDDENTTDNNLTEQGVADDNLSLDQSNEIIEDDISNNANVMNAMAQETDLNLSVNVDLGAQKQVNISPNSSVHWKKRKLESSLVETKEREIELANQEIKEREIQLAKQEKPAEHSDNAQFMVNSTSELKPTSEKATIKMPRVIVKDFCKEVPTKTTQEIVHELSEQTILKESNDIIICQADNDKFTVTKSPKESKGAKKAQRKRKIYERSQSTSITDTTPGKQTEHMIDGSPNLKTKKKNTLFQPADTIVEKITIHQKGETSQLKPLAGDIGFEQNVESFNRVGDCVIPKSPQSNKKKHKPTPKLILFQPADTTVDKITVPQKEETRHVKPLAGDIGSEQNVESFNRLGDCVIPKSPQSNRKKHKPTPKQSLFQPAGSIVEKITVPQKEETMQVKPLAGDIDFEQNFDSFNRLGDCFIPNSPQSNKKKHKSTPKQTLFQPADTIVDKITVPQKEEARQVKPLAGDIGFKQNIESFYRLGDSVIPKSPQSKKKKHKPIPKLILFQPADTIVDKITVPQKEESRQVKPLAVDIGSEQNVESFSMLGDCVIPKSPQSYKKNHKPTPKQTLFQPADTIVDKITVPQKEGKPLAGDIGSEQNVESFYRLENCVIPKSPQSNKKKHNLTPKMKSRKSARHTKLPINKHEISRQKTFASVKEKVDGEKEKKISKTGCSDPENTPTKNKNSSLLIEETLLSNKSQIDQRELISLVHSVSEQCLSVKKQDLVPSMNKTSKKNEINRKDLASKKVDSFLEKSSQLKNTLQSPTKKNVSKENIKNQQESSKKTDVATDKSSIKKKMSMSLMRTLPKKDVVKHQELKSKTVENSSSNEKGIVISSKENTNNEEYLVFKPENSEKSLSIKKETSVSRTENSSKSTLEIKDESASKTKFGDLNSENNTPVKTSITIKSTNIHSSTDNEKDPMDLIAKTAECVFNNSIKVENIITSPLFKKTISEENAKTCVQDVVLSPTKKTLSNDSVKDKNAASKTLYSQKKGIDIEVPKAKLANNNDQTKTTENMTEPELERSVSKGSRTLKIKLRTVENETSSANLFHEHVNKPDTKERGNKRVSSRNNKNEDEKNGKINLKENETNKGEEKIDKLVKLDTQTDKVKQSKEDGVETRKSGKNKNRLENNDNQKILDNNFKKGKKFRENEDGTRNATKKEKVTDEQLKTKSSNSRSKKGKFVENKCMLEYKSQSDVKMDEQDCNKRSKIKSVDISNSRSTELLVDNKDMNLDVGNEESGEQLIRTKQQIVELQTQKHPEESVADIVAFLDTYGEEPNLMKQKPFYQKRASMDLKKKLETFNKESVVQTSESDVENLLSLATDIARPTFGNKEISSIKKIKIEPVHSVIQESPTKKDKIPLIISPINKVQSPIVTLAHANSFFSSNLNTGPDGDVEGEITRNITGHFSNATSMKNICTTGKAHEILIIPSERAKTRKHLPAEESKAPKDIEPLIKPPETVIRISPKLFNFTAAQELGFQGNLPGKRYTPIRIVKMKPQNVQNASQLNFSGSDSSILQPVSSKVSLLHSGQNTDSPSKVNETLVRIEGGKSDSLSLFKCSQCNAIFWLKSSLQNHEKNVHHIQLDSSLEQIAKQEKKEKAVKIILDRIDKVLVNRSELEKLGIKYTPSTNINNQGGIPEIPNAPEYNSAVEEMHVKDEYSIINAENPSLRVETPIPMELYTPRIDSPILNSCEISQSIEVVKVRFDEQENNEICILMEIENCVEIETTGVDDETTSDNITFDSISESNQDITEKKYSCSFCSDTLLDEISLLDHLTEVHDKNAALTPERTFFKCVTCSAAFTQKDLHDTHVMETHIAINTYRCGTCPAEYFYKDHLKNHEKDKHTHKTFQEAFEKQIKFQSPQKVQTVEIETPMKHVTFVDKEVEMFTRNAKVKTYECGKCKMTFISNAVLYAHKKSEHAKKHLYKCRRCKAQFINKTIRYRHRCSTQTQFRCKTCRLSFQNKDGLIEHRKQKHDSGPSKCEYCHRIFKKNFNLVKHIKLKHSNTAEYNSLNADNKNKCSKNKKTCRIHGDIYDDLKIISQAPEYAALVNPALCEDELVSKFPTNIPKISLTATNNNSPEQKSLKNVCTAKLPFHCDNGKKILKRKKVLCVTARRLYKCLKCTAKFPQKAHLLNHIKKEHKLEPNRLHRCQHCSAVFKFEDKLSQHFKMKHYSADSKEPRISLQIEGVLDSTIVKKEKQHIEDTVNASTAESPLTTSHTIITPEMLTSAMFACTQCGAFLPTDALLQRHILMEHTQNTFVKCGQCGEILDKVNDLRKHMLLVHFVHDE